MSRPFISHILQTGRSPLSVARGHAIIHRFPKHPFHPANFASILRVGGRFSQKLKASPYRSYSGRIFPTIDSSQLVEEEALPFYSPELFYPVHIGEVLNSKYRVLGKLGYGDFSTVWLCRDLLEHKYVSLKICTTESADNQEYRVYSQLSLTNSTHPGQIHIRNLFDTFDISGPHGRHLCLVHAPMHLTLCEFIRRTPARRSSKAFLRMILRDLLSALDFLHTEANIVHTDLKTDNIMLSVEDESVLDHFCQAQFDEPCPRKVIDETRTIYTSRQLPDAGYKWGIPILCDFGDARIGKVSTVDNPGEAQPDIYRAPEVSFMMPWDASIDVWNVANLIWPLLEGRQLFDDIYRDGKYCAYKHMAKTVAFLGPPPPEFVARSTLAKYCFDDAGNWIANEAAEIPSCTLEDVEVFLKGKDKERFLCFIRSMLKWLPEERKSAAELLRDPWLNEPLDPAS